MRDKKKKLSVADLAKLRDAAMSAFDFDTVARAHKLLGLTINYEPADGGPRVPTADDLRKIARDTIDTHRHNMNSGDASVSCCRISSRLVATDSGWQLRLQFVPVHSTASGFAPDDAIVFVDSWPLREKEAGRG